MKKKGSTKTKVTFSISDVLQKIIVNYKSKLTKSTFRDFPFENAQNSAQFSTPFLTQQFLLFFFCFSRRNDYIINISLFLRELSVFLNFIFSWRFPKKPINFLIIKPSFPSLPLVLLLTSLPLLFINNKLITQLKSWETSQTQHLP